MLRRVSPIPLLLVLLAAASTPAVADDGSPLARRVREVAAQIVADPRPDAAAYHPEFLAQVPLAQLTGVFKQFFDKAGAVTRTEETSARGADYGEYRFHTAQGMTFPVKLGIEAAAPYRIHTLWFGLPQADAQSADDVVAKLQALHGRASLAVWRLDGGQPRLLHGLQPDLPLAIGSTFKLYVLGALVQEIEAGKLAWDRVARLDESRLSWPSGVLQGWPAGSPVTLHTLASEMISISDNTAADHLLFAVGRAKVEAAQQAMGHAQPALNAPFLGTRELFLLKETGHADRAQAYLALDAAGRRAYLDGPVAQLPREGFAGTDALAPVAIDRLEWFASASDLCRAMDWLRRHTDGGAKSPAAAARGVLAINPGTDLDRATWPYIGFKGGSEPGVLNLTWLLQRRDGAWYAVSTSWNDPAQSVDTTALVALMQGLIGVLAKE
jgi:beta-lactamase class A